MNKVDIWNLDNKSLLNSFRDILRKKKSNFRLNLHHHLNTLMPSEFNPIFVKLNNVLGLTKEDYEKYLGHRSIFGFENNIKLKHALCLYHKKRGSLRTSKNVEKKEETKHTPRIWVDESRGEGTYVSKEQASAFYKSYDWSQKRYEALVTYGRKCQCCGATPNKENAVMLNVDHIKPLKLYWSLRLDINNLQILCSECNKGKGNLYEHSFKEEK